VHRSDSGEQLTGRAADFEHALTAWHVRGEDLPQAASIIATGIRTPLPCRNRLPMRDPGLRVAGVIGGSSPSLRNHGASGTRCSRYHSTVRRSPVAKSVDDVKPNASRARVVSSFRRGWPLGLPVSHTMRPV